jgi:hypothetical protein
MTLPIHTTGAHGSAPVEKTANMLPDEAALRRDLAGGNFQRGVARGRWRLLRVTGSLAILAVAAAPRSPAAPKEYAFRFDCQGYPRQGPTAQPWNAQADTPLPEREWPAGTGRFALAFNAGWRPNGSAALYLPCDRLSLAGHTDWPVKHSHLIWTPDKDITFYLGVINDYLNSPEYTGARRPAS